MSGRRWVSDMLENVDKSVLHKDCCLPENASNIVSKKLFMELGAQRRGKISNHIVIHK